MFLGLNKALEPDLDSSLKSYEFIIDSMQEALFYAVNYPDDFDIEVFKTFLISKGRDNIKSIKKQKKPENEADQLAEQGHQDQQASPGLVEVRLNNPPQMDTTATLIRLNQLMIQNERFLIKNEIKEKKILELNRDLVSYRQKLKLVAEIEPKLNKTINENLRLKKILQELALVSKDSFGQHNKDILDLKNFTDLSSDLLEQGMIRMKSIYRSKKNLEKRVFDLENQIQEAKRSALVKKQKDKKKKCGFKAEVKELKRLIEEFKAEKLENDDLRRQKKELERSYFKARREIESFEATVKLLENNLELIGKNKKSDEMSYRKEVEEKQAKLEGTLAEHQSWLV